MAKPSISRRNFLKASAASAGVLGMGSLPAWAATGERRVIVLLLVGGPSQLETWDPKPDAPSEIRGPFSAIQTALPGVHLSEHFPRLAERLDRVALVRSLHHHDAPIHETGMQLVQTGRLARHDSTSPHVANGPTILPGIIESTGMPLTHGQDGGVVAKLTHDFDSRYGSHSFGRGCLQARRLIEAGTHCVTVNMFTSLYDQVTWDCHADGYCLNSTFDDYGRTLCPTFDQTYAALLDDLQERGLLDTTMVVALGEMGRTPMLNNRGGRDHWTSAWSALFAGGGVRGGQVIGASDKIAGEVKDRPVHASAVAGTIAHVLGGQVESSPIAELF